MSTDPLGLRPSSDLELDILIHELKGPVGVAEAAVRSLLERQDKFGQLSEKQEVVLRRALRGVQRSHHLIRDLLEVGRAEAGQFQRGRFHLGSALTRLLCETLDATDDPVAEWPSLGETERRIALRNAGAELDLSPAVADLEIEHDETKLLLLVGNLVRNALQARREGLVVRADLIEGALVLDVLDDGAGVPDGREDAIFERYARATQPGVGSVPGHGVGLAGVRYMARLLGGDVTLESTPGSGARFRITLPLEVPIT